MVRVLADRFELGERFGKGALSVVHEAVDRATGRAVAIKLAAGLEDMDSVRQRFDREASALSVISSAHVVELIWAGADEEGLPFLVLERLAGQNLQEVIAARGPFKPERVGRLIGQAARALELAHGVGIVHRDLKPANLFLHEVDDKKRILKVLDFGLVVDTGGPTNRMRDAFGGTPLYMAPEQVRGQLTRIGPATDMYALGQVTLTLLTGETYWTEGTADDVMREIESAVPAKPSLRWPWLTDAFDQWFLRSTQRVPERRFQAEQLLTRARDISIAQNDLPSEANADQLLGSVARERGEYAQAHSFHVRSLEIWQRLGDARETARARNYLAFAAWIGDYAGMPSDELLAWWDEIDEAELRALGDPEITVWYLLNRGAILHHKGDPTSRDVLGRAFAESISARFHEGIAWSLDQIGRVSFERGELLQARAQLAASLRVHRRLGDRWRCASVLEALAAVSVASDRPARGAVYVGAADTIREQIDAPVPACERPMLASTEARGVDMIGQAFDAGRERGHRTSLDQTVDLSRDVV